MLDVGHLTGKYKYEDEDEYNDIRSRPWNKAETLHRPLP